MYNRKGRGGVQGLLLRTAVHLQQSYKHQEQHAIARDSQTVKHFA
jgi:hypothetical protein